MQRFDLTTIALLALSNIVPLLMFIYVQRTITKIQKRWEASLEMVARLKEAFEKLEREYQSKPPFKS